MLSKPVSSPGPWRARGRRGRLHRLAAAAGADNRICLHARPPAPHSPSPGKQDEALDAPLGLMEPSFMSGWM